MTHDQHLPIVYGSHSRSYNPEVLFRISGWWDVAFQYFSANATEKIVKTLKSFTKLTSVEKVSQWTENDSTTNLTIDNCLSNLLKKSTGSCFSTVSILLVF